MEQPKKPGPAPTAAPSKDITDLKARLGLKRPEAGVPVPQGQPQMAGQMPGQMPQHQPAARGPAPGPAPGGFPGNFGGAAPAPRGGPAPAAAHAPQAAPQASPPSVDPFGMKPQQGMFDIRSIDDGVPVERVKSGAGKAVIITSFVVGVAAFALGAGMGISSVGRANMNTANRAAKVVKAELETMQKTVAQIASAFAASQQRLLAAKKDGVAYDPILITDLSKVKLDPRPDTSKIFRVDYYRLEDVVVDRLFNYYYDSIAVYGEVERHIRRTKNDAASLQSFTEKEGAKQAQNYGVVFDTAGKLTVANLVEVGEPACKDEKTKPCPADQMIGFNIRSNTGSPWVVRKFGTKGEGMVPLKPTPLMDTVMSGSPDSVRFENYKQRVGNIRAVLARLSAGQKELTEGVSKAAARPDVFTLFN